MIGKQKQQVKVASVVLIVFTILVGLANYIPYAISVRKEEAAIQHPALIHDDNPKSTATVAEISSLVNTQRQKAGLPPLKLDNRMNAAAQEKVDEMRNQAYYGHINPKSGKHGYSFADEHMGDLCRQTGENINGAISSVEAVDKWMASKPHRAAILNSDYDLVGYGVNGDYVVQLFCRLK